MISIFISSFLNSIIILSYGLIFIKFFFKKNLHDVDPWIAGLYGFIFIGFISLTINFFLPLNKFLGTIFCILSLIFFVLYFIKFKRKKDIFLIIIFVSITSFVLITYSNINRPDAGLYHLPYISILQENKIILGLTNLHYRFGHISIFQYVSSIFNFYFFKTEFLNLPLASLFPFFLLFLFKKIMNAFRTNNEIEITFIFLVIIFSIYSFNRFSNYGNDAPANIFFFLLTLSILQIKNIRKIENKNFFHILIISFFLLTLKPSMVIVLFLPVIIFYLSDNKILLLKHKNSFICLTFITLWIIKNILVSGCLIFPIKQTCLNSLNYYDKNIANIASYEAEAWAKGYPDSDKKINFSEYNSDFNWLNTWYQNHFNKILEKFFPFLFFIVIFFYKKIFSKSFYKKFSINKILKNKNIILIFFFSLFCTIFWFLYFPVYRFGMSFISTLAISLSVIIFTNNQQYLYKKNVYITIIGIGLILIFVKNLNRIINKYDVIYNNAPWPKIYTLGDNTKNIEIIFNKVLDKNDNFIFYYSKGRECMYSRPPCSNYYNKNLIKETLHRYDIFYSKKN